jgi:hypothetical protein
MRDDRLLQAHGAGWLPILGSTAFDISSTLPDDSGVGGILRAIFGYQAGPMWLGSGWMITG